jgi:uncharacterized repeat protein (TIGR03803 family)
MSEACTGDIGDSSGHHQATGTGSAATIYAFGGPSSPADDGAQPKGTLTAVTSGSNTVLYGRTAVGGPNGSNGCGIIFSINPDGTDYQVLYQFAGSDGCDPRHDAMTLDPNDGALYGTTQGVNQGNNASYGNFGQIYSFQPGAPVASPINAVHTFANPLPTSAPYDGAQQHSSFTVDPNSGALYGQTANGGANGKGMLYSVNTDGTGFTDLHDFSKSDADDPHGRIVLVDQTLYGIARQGGASNFGAVYAYGLAGTFTVLHTFAGGANDGATSDHGFVTPVVIDGRTVLFGMTQCGGTGSGSGKDACSGSGGGGDGVIFQVDPAAGSGSANFNIAYSFQGTAQGDGAAPYGSLMYDGTYLYGTTSAGGQFDKGTVFRLTPPAFGMTATPTVLYSFGGAPNDGAKPIDNVIEVGSTLYGLTVYGGAGSGTIFAVPLPP